MSSTESTSTTRFLPPTGLLFPTILLFFVGSGATGLLYQVVWTRKLVLLFGTTSYAVSTVLSVFFLGLAIGSVWGGCLADRSSRPLFLYGVMEIGIGVWALLFILFIDAGETLVVSLLQYAGGARTMGVGLRGLLATAYLIVPVTLMGATLPLLARFVTAQGPVLGSRIGTLYSVNTFGAVIGCATTGFVLIEAFGYTVTTLIGALLNIAIGVAAIGLGRNERGVPRPAGKPARPVLGVRPRTAALVVVAFGVSGFCSLALEVLWTRLLAIVFLGTTYAFTTMLATVLLGIAIGSAVAAGFVDRLKHHAAVFGLVQMLTAAGALATLPVLPELPERLREMQLSGGYDWGAVVRAKVVVSFLVLFVPTFLFGMSFPLALRAFAGPNERVGRDVGRLYAANTLGGVLGAFAGGFVLIPALGTHDGILTLSGVLAVAGLVLVLAGPEGSIAPRLVKAGVGTAAVAGMWIAAPADVSLALNRSYLPEDHELISYEEGIEGTVVVSEPKHDPRGSNRVLWINAVQATASIEKGVKMNRFQGMLPFVFNRELDSALFMCFGSGITAGTLGVSPLERIDAVEISEDVLDAAPLFGVDNFEVIENRKVNFIVDDGRNYLLRTEETYDLITFEPMPLALAGVSTFYTREYYRMCRARLKPGGLVSQWVPLHNGLDVETVRGLIATFVQVFPESTAWFINADLFLIGSNEPLRIDYALLERRWATMDALREGLAEVYLTDPVEFLASFFMDKEALERFTADAPIMTDDRPWAEFIAPKMIYERNVAEVLEALQPYRGSVLPLVDLPEGPRGARIRDAIDRRQRAHMQDMEGLKIYYGSGAFSEPEKEFRVSLEIDPEDANAKYYLGEILLQRGRMFTAWAGGDPEYQQKALALLREARPYALHRPEYFLALGDALDVAGKPEAADRAYARYVEMGGRAPRAVGRVQPVPAGGSTG